MLYKVYFSLQCEILILPLGQLRQLRDDSTLTGPRLAEIYKRRFIFLLTYNMKNTFHHFVNSDKPWQCFTSPSSHYHIPKILSKACVEHSEVKTKLLLGEMFMDSWFLLQTVNINNIHTSNSGEDAQHK